MPRIEASLLKSSSNEACCIWDSCMDMSTIHSTRVLLRQVFTAAMGLMQSGVLFMVGLLLNVTWVTLLFQIVYFLSNYGSVYYATCCALNALVSDDAKFQ
ncbi:hypothetical protein B0O99DRAFT_688333 [Bisporella sp. PMI_857]|nr:hypothetical protein B0O99DRAFT_688333 [Bisporella sp. PMI_857]